MSEMDRFMMQLSINFGRAVLVSMFLPLGVFHGCPRKSKKASRRS